MQPKLIARRIRNNLLMQKSKLEEYLILIEKEEDGYKKEDPDKIIAHINLEKQIIEELSSLNKILTPLEVIYYNSPYKKENVLSELKQSISNLSKDVTQKTKENKERLETILTRVKADLNGLTKLGIAKNSYGSVENKLVDISG